MRDSPRLRYLDIHTSPSNLFTPHRGGNNSSYKPPHTNHLQIALERTLLAYIRTSVVIAMQGVLIAQLFRLQQPGDRLKFYVAGKPLAVTCHCIAILVALIGAYRFWRQQGAISAGKVHAGGWEMNAVGILICVVSMRIGWGWIGLIG